MPDSIKWYLKPGAITIAFLVLGPLAVVVIPLILASPAFKRWNKVVMIVLIILYALLNIWALNAFVGVYGTLQKQMQELQAAMK